MAALYGPLHGGANEAVLRDARRIGWMDRVPSSSKGVKALQGGPAWASATASTRITTRAPGSSRRSRTRSSRSPGKNPLLDIALELERIALEDEYFVKRKLYPNVDFYSGLIYEAMRFPVDMFPVLFAIARTRGWLAQWLELSRTRTRRSPARARSTSGERRDYVPMDRR